MNALTLLSSNYQRTLESVNCPGSSFLYDSPNVGTVGIQFADGVRLWGGIMISHCRVFQSVSVFSRQYILKSEGEIGSGSPEKEQTRHMMLSCALLYFPQSATKYLWGHLPMMLRQSSGVCVETKTAKNQWIYAYISDILSLRLFCMIIEWMYGIVFSLHIYFLSEWKREKMSLVGWILDQFIQKKDDMTSVP